MRRNIWLIIGLVGLSLMLTGCARQSQKNAISSALNAESSNQASVDETSSTTVPSTMPSELQLPNATVELATTVEDGYQVSYTTTQSLEDVKAFYKRLEGWSLVAEFQTDEAESVSIERQSQRVLITAQPKSNATSVLVTGSFVKELKTGD